MISVGGDFIILDFLVDDFPLLDYVIINGSKWVRFRGNDSAYYTIKMSWISYDEDLVDDLVVVNFSTVLGGYALNGFVIPVIVNSSDYVIFRLEWYTKVSNICPGRLFGERISSATIHGGFSNATVLYNGYNLVNVTTYVAIIEGACEHGELIAGVLTFSLAVVMGIILISVKNDKRFSSRK